MTGDRLLWLYPRGWRERYGDEFLAIVGDRPLGLGEWIDIVSGAIDAHLSRDVRRAAASGTTGGGSAVNVIQALKLRQCGESAVGIREGLIGAAILIVGSLAAVAVKVWLSAAGQPEAGRWATDLSFPLLYLFVSNAIIMKGQSWRARLVVSGVLVIIFGLAVLVSRLT